MSKLAQKYSFIFVGTTARQQSETAAINKDKEGKMAGKSW